MSVARARLPQIIVLGFLLAGVTSQSVGQKNEIIDDDAVKVVDFQEMRYPVPARLSHIEGLVVVRLTLNSKGEVVKAIAMSGPKLLIADVLENVKMWRFRPNAQGSAIIVYNFRIRGLCHGTGSSQFIFEPPNFASITSCDAVVEPSRQ